VSCAAQQIHGDSYRCAASECGGIRYPVIFGQACGGIKEVKTAAEIVEEMVCEAIETLSALSARIQLAKL